MVSKFFLDVDKRKKYWEMGSMGVGRRLGFFFFFLFSKFSCEVAILHGDALAIFGYNI
jgi:hypothetical protein